MGQCQAIKADGTRCRAIAPSGSPHCPFHNPSRAEARRQASAKANAIRWKADPFPQIYARLDELYRGVLEGEISSAVGAVANQILITQLRAIEHQRRVKETEELARELKELKEEVEEMLEEDRKRRGRPTRPWRP
jgi:hypothetical protein